MNKQMNPMMMQNQGMMGMMGGKGGMGMGCGQGCMMGGKGGMMGNMGTSGRQAEAFLGQRMEGIVSSWKGQWGWVSCPMFTGAVFAHGEDVVGGMMPAQGAGVVFTIGKNMKGQVRAQMLQVGSMPPGGCMQMQAVKRKAEGLGGADKGFETVEGQQMQGAVTSWKNGWGWVSCEGFSGDLFAHAGDVQGGGELSVGELVAFVVGRDEKRATRWRAGQIIRLSAGGLS